MNDTPTQTVVIGLGVTGLACVNYLVKQGKTVVVNDSRDNPPGLLQLRQTYPEIEVITGTFSQPHLAQAEELIVSPGVSLKEPLISECIARGARVYGDVELFVQKTQAPIIAITGSNGKTTVTTLLGEMIEAAGKKASVCGNIGKPVLNLLNEPIPDFYVMELSSFQLETTQSLRAEAAVILNVSADHMDRYHSLDEYRQAKQTIYRGCVNAIVNQDEPEIWQAQSLPTKRFMFSLKHSGPNTFSLLTKNQKHYLAYEETPLIAVDALRLQGQHHCQNALSALALGYAVGLPMQPMLDVIANFPGLAHRCQWVSNRLGVDWYNDSKGTNVGASVAAIESLGKHKEQKLILIAGGDGKNADFAPLASPISQYVDHVILLGKDAPKIAVALKGAAPIVVVGSIESAVQAAAQITKPGDIVLLSPACASFDMFRNYEHRGEAYVAAIDQHSAPC